MSYQQGLLLKSEQRISPVLLLKLSAFLETEHIDVSLLDLEFDCLMRCRRLLLEQGVSHILSLLVLQEAVLPKVDLLHRDLLTEIIRDKLIGLSPSSSLTIIDSYFFPESIKEAEIATYIETLGDILEPVISDIKEITLITLPKYNPQIRNQVKEWLLSVNPQLVVSHKVSSDFHDRIWIVDEQKGLFIGTSLNGIGKKYALVDYIRDEDTQEISAILKQRKLLDT